MDNSVTVRTPGKINLLLDIVGKRTDGYHFMKTVMQSISLFDEITLTETDEDSISVSCNNPDIPCDENNLSVKAARAFFDYADIPAVGLKIKIEKNIPAEAGLGGGSSNAAGVLVGLNELTGAGLTTDQLIDIGEKIGADVPFCIIGGTALAEGIGEILTPLPPVADDFSILIAKPKEGISTAEAYKKYDRIEIAQHPDCDNMIAAIAVGGIDKIASYCGNVLEHAASVPEIKKIKELILASGALCSVMCGSGSAVFGIFEKKKQASACEADLKDLTAFTEICTTYGMGATII